MPHAERAKKRKDTVAGRATKRRNATARRRPTLPPQAAPRARQAVAATRPTRRSPRDVGQPVRTRRSPGGFGPGSVRQPLRTKRRRR